MVGEKDLNFGDLLSEISGPNPETFLWFIGLHVPGVNKL
jgi:hypothetical protein